MKNNSLEQIAKLLEQANNILIFPHIIMDGDTLGSSVALYKVLKNMGKEVAVLTQGAVPGYLSFLSAGIGTEDTHVIEDPDLCVAVDCSDVGRLGDRSALFFNASATVNIDHHLTNDYFAQYNYVDAAAAATAELIHRLIKQWGTPENREVAEALYTAIATDTGNFQYTNTTKETHLIAAELFDIGIDLEKVSVELYQNVKREKIFLNNEILRTMELFCDGKAGMAYVTQEMLVKSHATMEETDGIIETLRNMRGVEIAAFLKEQEPQRIKVGFRAKTNANVALLAQKFAGGGHKKAAGCTLLMSMNEAVGVTKEAIEQQLRLETDERG